MQRKWTLEKSNGALVYIGAMHEYDGENML